MGLRPDRKTRDLLGLHKVFDTCPFSRNGVSGAITEKL